MKTVALHNLGCKVNGYEMDVMCQKLQQNGYNIVPFDDIADIYIINTCTVTNIADRKSRQMLHRAKKENPNAIVIAVGCYVETAKDNVSVDDAIDLAVGNNKKGQIVEIIEEFLRQKGLMGDDQKPDKTLDGMSMVDINHTNEYEQMQLGELPDHTRAYIKIQDGCNQFCTYCIIPFARGRVRSRLQGDVMTEIMQLAKEGCKEVVLTGIHIGSYGLDRGGSELLELIKKIHMITGIERIRLGSLEPRIITKEFAEGIAALPKVCPHFHLSLQSGCDATLKRMNRHYDCREFEEGVNMLRRVYDRPAITTDVIVGFPGETEDEFKETVEFLERINFYEMHVFKYSKRHGTVAEKMPDQLTEKEKAARSDVLLEMTKRQSKAYRDTFIDQDEDVLWEDEEETDGISYLVGHTKRYVKVGMPADEAKAKGIKSGDITDVHLGDYINVDTLRTFDNYSMM